MTSISKEDLYLVFQTTRALNSVKVFNKIMKDKFETRNDDDIKTKDFIEMMLFHASVLWEIMYLLSKSLGKKYKGHINKDNQGYINDLISKIKSRKFEEIEILKEIRNKHSFHIADDKSYAIPFFTDGASRWDYKIGICRSSIEEDLRYTIEDTILIAYLVKRFSRNEMLIFELLENSISKYTKELLDLFNSILKDFVKDKVYVQQL